MNDLDGILQELGQFDKYQILIFTLLLFPSLFYSSASMTYVFTTVDGDYRCLIPECERKDSQIFNQPWLHDAIPFENGEIIEPCLRYKPVLNCLKKTCSMDSFSSETEECDKFIFGDDKNTITKEFGLLCERNKWKRTLVGTINQFAMLLGMPIAGVLSDRFGRKRLLLCSLTFAAIFGILRSLSITYTMYIIFEFLDAFSYSGVFNTFYVIGVEVVGLKWRGASGAIINSYYSLGEMMLGFIVLLSDDWRQYLRAVYIPLLLIAFLYSWILPESIRWLIVKKKKDKVTATVENIALWNEKHISDEIRKRIERLCSYETNEEDQSNSGQQKKRCIKLKEGLKSKRLILMVIICSFCWISVMFVYYGLSINSVNISGNKYWNFILVSFVEIPGYILSCFTINRCGRKITLCLGLVVSGVACSAYHFINRGYLTIHLLLYIIGKLAITFSSGTMYTFASEIFPTYLRNSLIGICSTMGRFGSIAAQQIPILEEYVDSALLYAALTISSAVLVLFLPETRNQPLPDSIQDTENLDNKEVLIDVRFSTRLSTLVPDDKSSLLWGNRELHRKKYVIVSTPMWRAQIPSDLDVLRSPEASFHTFAICGSVYNIHQQPVHAFLRNSEAALIS